MSEIEIQYPIQCPECGGEIRASMSRRVFHCLKCGKKYTESEIRERCGL